MQKSEKEKLVAKLRRAADAQRRAYSGNLYHEGIAQGLDDAAGILGKVRCEEEPHWIPCTERLPEDGKWCLFTDGEKVSVERYKLDAIDHFFPNGRWFNFVDAVAWMPLPKPYEERREADDH